MKIKILDINKQEIQISGRPMRSKISWGKQNLLAGSPVCQCFPELLYLNSKSIHCVGIIWFQKFQGSSQAGCQHSKVTVSLIKGLYKSHTWICDAEGTDPEVFTTGCSKLNIVTVVVMDARLGQHGVVFNFTLPVDKIRQIIT